MPPKKKQPDLSQKNKAKKAAKSAEDKTFGLKNKNKSKKVQQYVSQVQGQLSEAQMKKDQAAQKKALADKKAAEAAKLEAAKLFAPVLSQKIPFGVDPKSILCIYVKQNLQCPKGPKKCKFSHDVNVERKVVKKDLYTDDRSAKEEDTMDKWDEAKLRSVVMSKQGNAQTTTDKICKFFIEAVENGKYGWFWVCPNGGTECKYRHALPPGFVLKTKEQKRLEKLAFDQQPKITLEDFLETERDKLPKDKLTPINVETFAAWKEKHMKKKQDDRAKAMKENKKLTGREVILQKFADKFYNEDDNEDDKAFDLSQFKKDLDDVDEDIKDYGDGSSAFAAAQRAAAASAAVTNGSELKASTGITA